MSGDGGLYETWDRGETFMRLNNLPIGQFYDIAFDMRDPYYVYGGLQDNHSWMGPSETRRWTGIIADDWQQIGFGDGMHQQVDPTSARYVYTSSQSGNWTRVDALTGDARDIDPPEAEGEEHRFDWTSPGLVSRHRPNVIYIGGNRLFISRDRGLSWEATEDLTHRTDPESLSLMGLRGDTRSCSGRFDPRAAETAEAPAGPCILSKNDGATIAEITTIAESPLSPDILWVGTDDGAVQVSRDGGATWTDFSDNMTGGPDRPRACLCSMWS